MGRAPSQTASALPHVQTAIQDLCYTNPCWHPSQHAVPLNAVARIVTWAFPDARDADAARRAGIKTIAYLDPSIQYDPKRDVSPLASNDESTYLHACDGNRARVQLGDLDGFLMDLGAHAYRDLFHAYTTGLRAHYDVLFADDVFASTDSFVHVVDPPCARTFTAERDATFGAWRVAGMPILFNGLGLAPDDGTVSAHAVEALAGPNAMGGMYEMCFTAAEPGTDHTLGFRRVDGAWRSAENSQLAAVTRGKYFFCFAESPLDGASSAGIGDRIYTYASFLLTYDPARSVLEEGLRSAPRSAVPVYPETTLVAMQPTSTARNDVDELLQGGVYVRIFNACYLAQRPIGGCAAVVNPSPTATVPMPLRGYRAALALSGGSIPDGGHVSLAAAVPHELAPAGAAILIR